MPGFLFFRDSESFVRSLDFLDLQLFQCSQNLLEVIHHGAVPKFDKGNFVLISEFSKLPGSQRYDLKKSFLFDKITCHAV